METYRIKKQFFPLLYLIAAIGIIGCGNNDEEFCNRFDPYSPCFEVKDTTEWRTYPNLDEDESKWDFRCEEGKDCRGTKQIVTTPSMDGQALKFSLTGGEPNSNAIFSRNFPADFTAREFGLHLFFKYAPETSYNNESRPSIIQAIEFSMSKWLNHTRWEWAIQWENVAETGVPDAPTMRIWDGKNWMDTGQRLRLDTTWHHLTLRGKISEDKVHYINFEIDRIPYPLGQKFDPQSEVVEDKIAIHLQLDGTRQQAPYDVVVDEVQLMFRPFFKKD